MVSNNSREVFCEVAASLDYLFEGPGGYKIKPGGGKGTKRFSRSSKRYCVDCSGALPMKGQMGGKMDLRMTLFH